MNKNQVVVIADPNPEPRSRLKEVLKASFDAKIVNARALENCLESFQLNKYHFAFISTRFGKEKINAFLSKLKSFPAANRPEVIICLSGAALDPTVVAQQYTQGVLGFLCEPFSAESVKSLMDSAKESEGGAVGATERERRAISFLLNDAVKNLDAVAERLASGERGGGFAGKALKEIGQALKERSKNVSPEVLADLMLEKFSKAKPAQRAAEVEKKTKKRLKAAIHPGAELKEIMAKRNLAEARLIELTGIPAEDFAKLLGEELEVTDKIARDLSRALGKTAAYWLGLQKAWNAYQAQQKEDDEKNKLS